LKKGKARGLRKKKQTGGGGTLTTTTRGRENPGKKGRGKTTHHKENVEKQRSDKRKARFYERKNP